MSQTNKDRTPNVRQMFSSIAHRYDLLNHILSFGIDIYWRKKAVSCLKLAKGDILLDVAAGTCDVSLEMTNTDGIKVTAADFSLPMLQVGKGKAAGKDIAIYCADAQRLPFKDASFNGSIIAFGLRNLPDRAVGIEEMRRVVKDGGRVVILEFSTPTNPVFKWIYYFYFTKILPVIGGIISGKREAYEYLPESVLKFPDKDTLKKMMEGAGLRDVIYKRLTFGIAFIHVGVR